MAPPSSRLLTDAEVREFQALVADHAVAALTFEQADALAHQLLRVLFIIRETARQGSTDSISSVDQQGLPATAIYVDTKT